MFRFTAEPAFFTRNATVVGLPATASVASFAGVTSTLTV